MQAKGMLAAAYFESGIVDLARDNFEQVMATAPDVKVAMTLAEIERSEGNIDASVDWLQKAVELDPAGMPARQSLANVELKRGNTDTAAKLLRDLRKDYPNAPELNLLAGEVYLALGNYKDSIAAFDRALAVQPTEFLTLRRYAAGNQSGQDDAWRALAKWFADHPGHINAGLQLAQAYGEREWHDQSVATYEKVLKVDPGNVLALNNIAWAYLARGRDGDLKRGLDAASKAYNKMPQFAAVGDTYGWLLVKDGQHQRAVEILATAAAGTDVDPEISYHYAVALEAVGKDAEAAALLDRLLADDKSFDSRADAEALQRRLSP
jgi:tetratricopeptide (TPR) repeat protein